MICTWFVWCIGWLNFRSRFGRGTVKFIIHSYFVTTVPIQQYLSISVWRWLIISMGSLLNTHTRMVATITTINRHENFVYLMEMGNTHTHTFLWWQKMTIEHMYFTVLYCVFSAFFREMLYFLFPPLFDFNPHSHAYRDDKRHYRLRIWKWWAFRDTAVGKSLVHIGFKCELSVVMNSN